LVVTEKQLAILESIAKAPTESKQLIQHALFDWHLQKMFNEQIAGQVGLNRQQVGVWRWRWADSFDSLVAIEFRENGATRKLAIEHVLSDAPRSGSPGTFTPEQVTHILAVACQSPGLSNRPIDH